MKEIFNQLAQRILEDTVNAISSPESVGGVTRSGSPVSKMTTHSGQAVRRVSRSLKLENKPEKPTSDICGQSSSISSASAALTSSLASRLKARLPTAGSTIYTMTWKEKVTPAGRRLSRLVASVPRTSASGCSGWVTPMAFDATNDGSPRALRYKGSAPSEIGNTRNPDSPGSYRGDLKDWVALAAWPTPTAQDSSRGAKPPRPQDTVIPLGQRVAQIEINHPRRKTASGETRTGSSAGMGSGGRLNPNHPRWLMGYPQPWMDVAPSQESVRSVGSATRSSRKRQQSL